MITGLRSLGLVLITLLLVAAPAATQQMLSLPLGSFEYAPTVSGILVTAPHGTADRNTDAVATEAARVLGAGYVVARGFNPGARINVSYPTEGSGIGCAPDQYTQRAREVFAAYQLLVALTAGGAPLRLYIEVHGNDRVETARNVEVATKGLSPAAAAEVKASFPSILQSVQTEWSSYPTLQLLIEPVDRIYWTASCAKQIGMIASDSVPRALHFELPVAARVSQMIPATAALIARLVEEVITP